MLVPILLKIVRNEASGDTLQASGSKPGDSLKLSSHGNEVNCSKIKGNTSTNNSGNGRGRGTVGGRRESDDLDSGEMEVITLDSSDAETASELEEEAQILRLIKKQIGRK